MIHKRVDKVKNQDGMYLVFNSRTFEPVFLTDIENTKVIMDTVAMNSGFQGIELKQSDKRYYLMKLGEYHGYTPEWVVNRLLDTMSLASVTLDFLKMLQDKPIINVDEAFMAFLGEESDVVMDTTEKQVKEFFHTW